MDISMNAPRPGDTCWRVEQANRPSVTIEAIGYFATLRRSAQIARQNLMPIGWDFDTRVDLDTLDGSSEVLNRLGRFLNWLVKTRPDLPIDVLEWGARMLLALRAARRLCGSSILDRAVRSI